MKSNTPTFRPRLTPEQVDFCMVHLLRVPELFDYAKQYLKPGDFDRSAEVPYMIIWAAALAVAERNGNKLPESGTEYIIGTEVQAKIEEAGTTIQSISGQRALDLVKWAFEKPKEQLNAVYYRSVSRDLICERTALGELRELVQRGADVGVPVDLAARLEQLARKARQVESIAAVEAQTLKGDWADYLNRLQIYRGRDMIGLTTGMRQLDDRTLGLRGLTVLGAMPNVGKTALVLQLGLGVIRNNPDACFLVVSLEMDRQALYSRIHCNLAQMDWTTLMLGDRNLRGTPEVFFAEEQQQQMRRAEEWVKDNGHRIRVLDRQTLGDKVSASTILDRLNAFKVEAGAKRALIAIDYLQLIPVPDEVARNSDLEADKHRVRAVQDIAAGTQSIVNPIGDAVLAISEARKPGGKGGWGESLQDLMGSARLGYAADAVLLYRAMSDKDMETFYTREGSRVAPTRGQLENDGISPIMLELAKGRDGMRRGQWGIEFLYRRSMFREIEQPFNAPLLPLGRREPRLAPSGLQSSGPDLLAFANN